MMSSRSLLTMSIGVLLLTAPASGQWLGHRTEGIPRTSEGQPNFAAPAPRMPDRRIDFSGLWQLDPQGKVLTTIAVGQRPWNLALSPDGTRLYTANGVSNDVSVVDTRAGKVVRTIAEGTGPWGIADSRRAADPTRKSLRDR